MYPRSSLVSSLNPRFERNNRRKPFSFEFNELSRQTLQHHIQLTLPGHGLKTAGHAYWSCCIKGIHNLTLVFRHSSESMTTATSAAGLAIAFSRSGLLFEKNHGSKWFTGLYFCLPPRSPRGGQLAMRRLQNTAGLWDLLHLLPRLWGRKKDLFFIPGDASVLSFSNLHFAHPLAVLCKSCTYNVYPCPHFSVCNIMVM